MNILLLTAHDVAEYDDLRMFTDMGHDVWSIGAYTNPHETVSGIRPSLPQATRHERFEQLCIEQREKHAGDPIKAWIAGQEHNLVDWAKADLHQDIIDWADVIVVHHYLESWVYNQWDRLRDKRVIWRTCGQSNAYLEETMGELHKQGMGIVRYSPQEEQAFRRLGVYAGGDVLIRFGKYPSDYGPWVGDDLVVGNITQNMAGRGEFCGYPFWKDATRGLPVKPAGLQSENIEGGIGALEYPEMLEYLNHLRVYLYTGTQPASYTLALIEAMMSGVPVVSMDPSSWWVPDLFEGHLIAERWGNEVQANAALRVLLRDDDLARACSARSRERAIELFGIEKVKAQWADYLG
jgi:glycosyltransferase involved in cell wall biosynthesis